MKKRTIKQETIKFLLLRAGNKCAFSDCNHVIFNDDNLLVAQLCHIESVSPGGQRYNPNNSLEQNNSYENLLFLCYRHHKESANVIKYPVSKLKQIKNDHENKLSENTIYIVPNMLIQVEKEINNYWNHIKNIKENDETGMMIEINAKAKFEDIVIEINSNIKYLFDVIQQLAIDSNNLNEEILQLLQKLNVETDSLKALPYYENPLVNRNWEILNIGASNALTNLNLKLKQLYLKYSEEVVKNNIEDFPEKLKFEQNKIKFKKLIQKTYLAD
jgi:hypothetical protein